MGNSTLIKIHKDKLKELVSPLDSITQNVKVTTALMITVLMVTQLNKLCLALSRVLKRLLSMNTMPKSPPPLENQKLDSNVLNNSDLIMLTVMLVDTLPKCFKQSLDAEKVLQMILMLHSIQK